MTHVVHQLSVQAEFIGLWSESCWCHEDVILDWMSQKVICSLHTCVLLFFCLIWFFDALINFDTLIWRWFLCISSRISSRVFPLPWVMYLSGFLFLLTIFQKPNRSPRGIALHNEMLQGARISSRWTHHSLAEQTVSWTGTGTPRNSTPYTIHDCCDWQTDLWYCGLWGLCNICIIPHVFFQFRNCAHAEFLRYTAELSVSSKKSDRAECQQLYVDWNKARCRIWMETIAKLSHYQQLPYKLLQLAHHDPYQRVLAAQCCLLLWKQGGVGCKHRQSRRFLDPAWQGGEGDPSLLPLVQRIARGEDMLSSHDFSPLIDWVSRFACIRLAERSVEGVHSMMTRILKRGPASSIPYISVELRFEGFWTYLCNDPPVARSKWEVRVNDTYTVRLVS